MLQRYVTSPRMLAFLHISMLSYEKLTSFLSAIYPIFVHFNPDSSHYLLETAAWFGHFTSKPPLKMYVSRGRQVCILDLEEKDLPAIAYRVSEDLFKEDLIRESDKGPLMRMLLVRHRHVNEQHDRRFGFTKNKHSYTSLQVFIHFFVLSGSESMPKSG